MNSTQFNVWIRVSDANEDKDDETKGFNLCLRVGQDLMVEYRLNYMCVCVRELGLN